MLDVPVPQVIQQIILEYGVDEVKFLPSVGEKMLTTNTSGQASFSNLAKKCYAWQCYM